MKTKKNVWRRLDKFRLEEIHKIGYFSLLLIIYYALKSEVIY